MRFGRVYLVGAGPGHPELVTVRGRRLLELADAVLYDHLAPRELLDYCRPEAERVYVGKKRSRHTFTQEEISGMLVERALAGKTVVRLKGGDPLIFARGGEELEALAGAGVPFEVVPGVTTPVAIAAYCGVPLTHREHASIVTFVTGHDVEAIDWEKACAAETLVLFMALTKFGDIARRLIAAGKPPSTPALAVRWASRPDQQTVTGTLADLGERIQRAGLRPPATAVVGEVVALRDRLNWFERLPLFGRRVVVTRARVQAGALGARLRELGAEVIELPAIEIRDLDDYSALDAAIERLEDYDWLIFTSVNGVEHFLRRLDHSRRDLRSIRGRLAAIGPATAAHLRQLHLKVDVVPNDFVAESLLAAFAPYEMAGRRVLIPRAQAAREILPEQLRARGAKVDVAPAYRTMVPEEAAGRVAEAFSRRPDWITFTSSSTVTNFVRAAGKQVLEGVRIASIGPVTSGTVRSYGLTVDAEAQPYTIDGLVAALVRRHRGPTGAEAGAM